jgi:2-iminobutanoate/2-iminopropanoate deaminase
MKRYITELPFPFSKAISAGGFLFLSGQVAMSEQGEPIYGDVKSQTRYGKHKKGVISLRI